MVHFQDQTKAHPQPASQLPRCRASTSIHPAPSLKSLTLATLIYPLLPSNKVPTRYPLLPSNTYLLTYPSTTPSLTHPLPHCPSSTGYIYYSHHPILPWDKWSSGSTARLTGSFPPRAAGFDSRRRHLERCCIFRNPPPPPPAMVLGAPRDLVPCFFFAISFSKSLVVGWLLVGCWLVVDSTAAFLASSSQLRGWIFW